MRHHSIKLAVKSSRIFRKGSYWSNVQTNEQEDISSVRSRDLVLDTCQTLTEETGTVTRAHSKTCILQGVIPSVAAGTIRRPFSAFPVTHIIVCYNLVITLPI